MAYSETDTKTHLPLHRAVKSGYRRHMTTTGNAPEFDTLAATRELVAAGLERKQAEAVVATGRVSRVSRAGLATKADLDHLEARLEAKIERGVNRTLLAIITIGGIIVAAVIASAFAVINQLP